ncbi:hypothetical protein MMC18_001575 [Xylographa bjoerkii]|nr:hypothetical protein [Xylographa bjoerkii]
MPEPQNANHPHHLAPPGPDDATPNHNLTTLDTESADYQSVLSESNGNINGSRRARRFRDRLKAALGLENGASRKAGPMYSETFEQIVRPLHTYPEGYGKVAAVEDCDPNFLICRKFGELHLRVLLHRQDELAELEDDLERLDKDDYSDDFKKLKSRRRDYAVDSDRKDLLTKIEEKLAAYDELLLRIQQIHSIKRPTRRNQSSLYNWIRDNRLLAESESVWIRHGDDLAALANDQEHGWFGGFVEDTLIKLSRTATMAVFRTREQHIKSGHEIIVLLSRKRFNAFIYVLITIIATALLLFPVFILDRVVRDGVDQLLVIFAFTLAFAACCSIFTNARKQEVFGAAAAYCAVLVVFLGHTTSNNVTGNGVRR